ncbi:MAG: hypothetical protein Q4D05_07415 [Acinetobacter sp.]|nr:hypothetical protein [Acinetobacter sp.]
MTNRTTDQIDPTLDLERVRQECLELVKKRAYVSAGVAVIPIPFFDVMMDVGILSQLIPEINARFGLSESRSAVFDVNDKTVNWQELKKRGVEFGSLFATRAAVKSSFQGFFSKMVTKQISKYIPLGGQMVSAGLGYFMMKKIAEAHVEESYQTAKRLQQAQQAKTVSE